MLCPPAGLANFLTCRCLLDSLCITHPPCPQAAPPEAFDEWAFRYGRSYDSYLATESDRECFWSRDRRGAVAFVRAGRYLFASGGLLTRDEDKESLLAEFVEFADRQKLLPSFFNALEDELPLFRDYGFQVTKWGEEAIVDLSDRDWQGKAFEWVRRQSNFCRRHGIVVEECKWNCLTPTAWRTTVAELTAVSAAYLATKPQQGEIGFLEGRFPPENFGGQRLFVARSDDGRGRVEGFLVCNPALAGERWIFETYRHRPDAVRGISAYLMHQAMCEFQSEGIASVSLCLVPGLRCEQPHAGDSGIVRWGMLLGTRYCGLILDSSGLYHFKSRFRPRFENRYVCVRPRATLGWARSFISVLGVMRLDLPTVAGQMMTRLRKRAARKTLELPEARSA